jgi:hypothetical protein
MTNGMITDKGVFDAVWCSMMWLDDLNEGNRVKPERDYDPMQSIVEALFTGIHSKWVFINKTEDGVQALPYGESFWLHIPFTHGKFLLTTHEVVLGQTTGSGSNVTVVRNKKYDPRDEDAVEAEKFLQVLMIQHVFKFFPEADQVKVLSRYPSYPDQEMSNPSLQLVDEADDWAYQLWQQRRGIIPLIARHEKCYQCWWRSCPSRKIDSAVPSVKFKEGKSRASGILD